MLNQGLPRPALPPAGNLPGFDRGDRVRATPQPWTLPKRHANAAAEFAAAPESRDRHREKSLRPRRERLSFRCRGLPSPRPPLTRAHAAGPPSTLVPWDELTPAKPPQRHPSRGLAGLRHGCPELRDFRPEWARF